MSFKALIQCFIIIYVKIEISAVILAKCKLHIILIATVAMAMVVFIPINKYFLLCLHSYFLFPNQNTFILLYSNVTEKK